ncbi:MnhB domain-containing protein [Rubrimonas cliftonensis]|uniref:Multisubunit sodium/proton antiporter, MrpB subunit n=1 Tax=Rubrimonas cliftonensis TaxID=89524 RepID=A0A1H4D3R4_9RHOB|nr:MnhB domain-containing protein [Rubrimonas cliftonensis]SEA67150.1 multisubunit sodium/proton antiporter, MrpB subunit [Rubrimonas cliftonensis]
MTSPIVRAAARIVVALMLVYALYALARGHNAPGGGFIGGLIAACAYAVLAMTHGVSVARAALRFPPEAVAAAGFGLALLSGLIAGATGAAPFTGLWPFIGEGEKGLPISTVLLFDVGVWLTVLGGALTIVFALEEDE